MARSPAICAFALVALLCGASAGCSATAGSLREVDSPGVSAAVRPLVGPATVDAANAYLPAVTVLTMIIDSTGKAIPKPCSGVLVHQRVVMTAGHCVCLFREPTSSDNLPTGKSREPDAGAVVTRAGALEGKTVTGILDGRSPCARKSLVDTIAYGKPGEEPQHGEYSGDVVVHPEIELIAGAPQGQSSVFWNNADLAAILLDHPVSLASPPIVLTDSEVRMGDGLVMVGYGSAGATDPYGTRRSGGNNVTEILTYEKGNVIFGAAAPASSDGGVPAHARPGDSGGACVRKENTNVLIGIVTTGEQSDAGNEASYFTSIYRYEKWLSEIIRRAGPAADAGVSVPHSDAGSAPSLPPAAR